MKKNTPFSKTISIFTIIAIVAVVANIYLSNNSDKCANNTGNEHIVIIKDNIMSPSATTAKLCDKLTIVNEDEVQRIIAFGQHDNHISYDGITEKEISKDQRFSVTLNELGDYLFHDHDQEEVSGTFLVIQ
jgi:hypothetical protein